VDGAGVARSGLGWGRNFFGASVKPKKKSRMNFLYWIFGVEKSLRQSLPSLSVYDEGLSRGWLLVFSVMILAALWWSCRTNHPFLKPWQNATLALLRWGFFVTLFFFLVHPVLVLAGEEMPGLPEIEKIDLASAPVVLGLMLFLLCTDWWLRHSWRLK